MYLLRVFIVIVALSVFLYDDDDTDA